MNLFSSIFRTLDIVKKEQRKYYINQLNEVDAFIKELIEAIVAFNEKTVLVIYGDHLPGFELEEEDLLNNNLYQTEYVIWNNINMPKKDKDLYTYQLFRYLLTGRC